MLIYASTIYFIYLFDTEVRGVGGEYRLGVVDRGQGVVDQVKPTLGRSGSTSNKTRGTFSKTRSGFDIDMGIWANLRKSYDFYIPRVKSNKIGLLPSHNFTKICYENKRHFSKLLTINLISNFRQNLIEDFHPQTNILIRIAMFANESKKAKSILPNKKG